MAHQDFFMTNEFFSLPQSFIIKAIVSPRICPCAFKNRTRFFPCILWQMQLSSKQSRWLSHFVTWYQPSVGKLLCSSKDNFCSRNSTVTPPPFVPVLILQSLWQGYIISKKKKHLWFALYWRIVRYMTGCASGTVTKWSFWNFVSPFGCSAVSDLSL